MEKWKGFGGKLRLEPKTYPSKRRCPSCGGPMIYLGSGLSALTGKYSRTCLDCGHTDPHKVRMVRQI